MATIDALLPESLLALDDEAIAEHYNAGTARSWVRANFVSSADGAVTVDGKSGGLGGEADHRVFDILRRLSDVVLVGAGTVRAEGYGPLVLDAESVDARVALGLAPQPTFAIVTGSLDLDPGSEIFEHSTVKPILITTEAAPAKNVERFSSLAEVIVAGTKSLDVAGAVAALADRGLTRIHCEGGPSLFGSLLAEDVVDELCLTVSPLLAAGDSGRISAGEVPEPRGMSLAGVLHSGDTLMLRYARAR
jgi:riboflavin biosynthesis pyrimidine reductase